MTKLIVLVISALAAAVVSAQLGTCKLDQQQIQKAVLECASHDPVFMFTILEHIKNPESVATTGFICQNQNSVVNLLMCLEDKMLACLGNVKDSIKPFLPNHDRWETAVTFMCDHKTDLIETNCMNQDQVQEFMQCYMGKLVSVVQPAMNKDFKGAVCSVIHSEEQCIQTYHGTCSQTYVSLIIQFLDKLFPFCPAQTVDIKNQVLSDAMGSILVQGQPLKFQPQGNVPYKIFQQK